MRHVLQSRKPLSLPQPAPGFRPPKVFGRVVGCGEDVGSTNPRVFLELVHMRRNYGQIFKGRRRKDMPPIHPRIPYDWILDTTRTVRGGGGYLSIDSYVEQFAEDYYRDRWQDQKVYVELWIEKDALAEVLLTGTQQWNIPIMVSRGFSSVTFLYNAARVIKRQGKPAFVYVFTDYDTAGEIIAMKIKEAFATHAPASDITVKRVAVTKAQIRKYKLPLDPTKGKGVQVVELDALPPDILQQIARECIEPHINKRAWKKAERIEKQERQKS